MTRETNHQPPPALKRMEMLVGAWQIEITLPGEPPMVVQAQATFEWSTEGAFLVQRSSAERADFPKGVSIIGCDGVLESYSVLYYDSRGIARLYHMSLSDREWKQWRDDPAFRQRFTGTFSEDGNTITARWEKSSDGKQWELDFEGVYTKVRTVDDGR
jgi:hypothetical protein